MSYVDEVIVNAKAGDGGNGIVAWRREAHVPKGGPAGGDGGDGGSVVLVAEDNVHSLLDYKFHPHLKAQDGQPGRGKNQAGHFGADRIGRVPVGTQVFDDDTGALIADLTEAGQRVVVCKGGSGGFGNSRFATPSRQAPEIAKPGLPGEERRLRLSLKVMADVGLLGFPNAGKSTLLARVSAARPKIASYPFTTLVPQLGVVRVDADEQGAARSFVLADIPGLIEGASDGAGLGVRFLKHLERVRVLCHLIEAPLEGDDAELEGVEPDRTRGPRDLVQRYQVLRGELERFSAELAALPEIVVVNKTDVAPDIARAPAVARLKKHLDKRGTPLLFMSGASGEGVQALVYALWQRVSEVRQPDAATAAPAPFNPFARAR